MIVVCLPYVDDEVEISWFRTDSDELVPEDGKDEVYDTIMSEINELEEELAAELKSIRKKTGSVYNAYMEV